MISLFIMCTSMFYFLFHFIFRGYVQVIRGGRRVEVSIYDLVVGDVIPLNIGDQVFVAVSIFCCIHYHCNSKFIIYPLLSSPLLRYLLMVF